MWARSYQLGSKTKTEQLSITRKSMKQEASETRQQFYMPRFSINKKEADQRKEKSKSKSNDFHKMFYIIWLSPNQIGLLRTLPIPSPWLFRDVMQNSAFSYINNMKNLDCTTFVRNAQKLVRKYMNINNWYLCIMKELNHRPKKLNARLSWQGASMSSNLIKCRRTRRHRSPKEPWDSEVVFVAKKIISQNGTLTNCRQSLHQA